MHKPIKYFFQIKVDDKRVQNSIISTEKYWLIVFAMKVNSKSEFFIQKYLIEKVISAKKNIF